MVFHIKFHIREKGEEGVGADGRPWHGFGARFFLFRDFQRADEVPCKGGKTEEIPFTTSAKQVLEDE